MGVVSCRARAVQLLGSISEMSLRSLASRADILRQGWSLRCTKPSSLQDGWEAPLHRYFTAVCPLFFPLSVFFSSIHLSALFWELVSTYSLNDYFLPFQLQRQCISSVQ